MISMHKYVLSYLQHLPIELMWNEERLHVQPDFPACCHTQPCPLFSATMNPFCLSCWTPHSLQSGTFELHLQLRQLDLPALLLAKSSIPLNQQGTHSNAKILRKEDATYILQKFYRYSVLLIRSHCTVFRDPVHSTILSGDIVPRNYWPWKPSTRNLVRN